MSYKPNLPILDGSKPIASGMFGAWLFYEGAGTVVRDISGRRHDGPITGAVWGSNRYGSTLTFDGSNDHVNVGEINDQAVTGQITVFMKFRGDSKDGMVMARYDATGGGDFQPAWVNTGTPQIRARIGPGGGDVKTGAYTLGTWVDIVTTFDSSTLKIYRDGALEDSVSSSQTFASNNEPWLIGTDPDATGGGNLGNYFHGDIAAVMLWSRILSLDEIRQLTVDPYSAFRAEVSPAVMVAAAAGGSINPQMMQHDHFSGGMAL